jgi:hypothetical protein
MGRQLSASAAANHFARKGQPVECASYHERNGNGTVIVTFTGGIQPKKRGSAGRAAGVAVLARPPIFSRFALPHYGGGVG